MAPTFVQASAGTVITTGSGAVSLSGAVSGNFLMLAVTVDGVGGTPSIGSPSQLNNLAGSAGMTVLNASGYQVGATLLAVGMIWFGRATGSSPSITVTTPGDDLYCQMYEFADVNTGTNLSDVWENDALSVTAIQNMGTGTTVSAFDVETNGADRLCIQTVFVNDDNALVNFTGESGGDYTIPSGGMFGSATGTDGEVGIQIAEKAAAGTITGGSYTQASDAWGTVGFALIPGSSANTYTKAGFGKESG